MSKVFSPEELTASVEFYNQFGYTAVSSTLSAEYLSDLRRIMIELIEVIEVEEVKILSNFHFSILT
jgi:hypothetical protein